MAKICKYCGKESPNASKKCKYCAKPFATVKTQGKASTKKDDKTTKKPLNEKDDKTTKKSSSTKATAKKDGKTSATKVGNKKDDKSLLTKPKAKKDDKIKTTKKVVGTAKPAKKETKSTAKKTSVSKSDAEKSLFGTDQFDLFTVKGYLNKWANFAKRGNAGILLTNTSRLANTSTLIKEIKNYCAARKPYVRYALLDLGKLPDKRSFNDCPSIVALLKEIYKYAVPSYLMIVGDPTVIPYMNWENRAGDGDKYVPSDLAYITLDTRSPFDGCDYSLQGATKVGRILASPINGFANAIKYFQFTASYTPQKKVKPFALTAYQWITRAGKIFKKLNCSVLSSPMYTCRDYWISQGYTRLPNLNDRNILGFNVHGASATNYWYGQRNSVYPEAFGVSNLPYSKSGYTLCASACYGAHPEIVSGSNQSIVVTAISNGCVAFVGSTRIAYGSANGGMCCGDVILNAYIDSITDSKTTGQALLDALTVVKDKYYRNEYTIKTIVEFALYGDPSIVVFSGKKEFSSASAAPIVSAKMVKTKVSSKKAIRLIPCDPTVMKSTSSFNEYADQIKKAEDAIKTVVSKSDNFVAKNFSPVQNVKPKVFKVADSNEYRTIYTTTNGKVITSYHLLLDGKGKVIETYVSI